MPPMPVPSTIPTSSPNLDSVSNPASSKACSAAKIDKCADLSNFLACCFPM